MYMLNDVIKLLIVHSAGNILKDTVWGGEGCKHLGDVCMPACATLGQNLIITAKITWNRQPAKPMLKERVYM